MRRVKSIFVLDDDLEQAELLAAALQDATATKVRIFSDPLRALAAVNDEGTDLLVADIAMPLLDGVHVVHSAWVKHPNLKVILVSGSPGGEEIARRIGLPFFAKPIDLPALSAAARAALL